MGASESKSAVKQLNESITNITTKTVVKNTTLSSGSLVMNQNINLKGGVYRNTSMTNSGTINLSVLKDSTTNTKTQSELIDKITNEINKQSKTIPTLSLISSDKSESDIRNIVKKNINASFSQDNIEKMDISGELNQNLNFEDVDMDGVTISQIGASMGKMVTKTTNNIVNDIIAGTDLDNTSTEETELGGVASDAIGAVGGIFGGILGGGPAAPVAAVLDNGINNAASSTGLSPIIITFIFILIIGGVLYFYFNKRRPPGMGPPGMGPPGMGPPGMGPPGMRPPGMGPPQFQQQQQPQFQQQQQQQHQFQQQQPQFQQPRFQQQSYPGQEPSFPNFG